MVFMAIKKGLMVLWTI